MRRKEKKEHKGEKKIKEKEERCGSSPHDKRRNKRSRVSGRGVSARSLRSSDIELLTWRPRSYAIILDNLVGSLVTV